MYVLQSPQLMESSVSFENPFGERRSENQDAEARQSGYEEFPPKRRCDEYTTEDREDPEEKKGSDDGWSPR